MGAAKKPQKSIAEQMLDQFIKEGRATLKELSIRSIVQDSKRFQSRVRTDMAHVNALGSWEDNGIPLGPVVCFLIAGVYHLVDGFHRLKLWTRKGQESCKAWVVEGTEHEAMLFCVSANLWIGKMPDKEDRTKAVRMMFADEECWTWNDTLIGKRTGLSPRAVGSLRRRFAEDAGRQIPTLVKVFLPDGQFKKMSPYGTKIGTSRSAVMKSPHGSLTIANNKGYIQYRLSHKGKSVHVGSAKKMSREEACQKAEEIIATGVLGKESSAYCPKSLTDICRWLECRGITMETCSKIDGRFLGTISASAGKRFCLSFVTDQSVAALDRAIVSLLIAKSIAGMPQRCVVARKEESTNWVARRISILSEEYLGIEFMSPDEIVAEFGPKDGDPATEPTE